MISDSKQLPESYLEDSSRVIPAIRGQDQPPEPTLSASLQECIIDIRQDCHYKVHELQRIQSSFLKFSDDESPCRNELDNQPKEQLKDDDVILTKTDFEMDIYESLDDNANKLRSKYGDRAGELILLNLPNPRLSNCKLGLMLSGNRNPNIMSVFICRITENSLADIDGRLRVGDEILEIDGHSIYGRSHLNASPIIQSCKGKMIKFVIIRSISWIVSMAIPVIYHGIEDCNSTSSSRRESMLDFMNDKESSVSRKTSSVSLGATSSASIATEEQHIIYLNKKGSQGFGFAIMHGSFTNEEGIFIKHIAPFGPAAQDGSFRPGDRLISINNQDISKASYETALELLKNCKGQTRLEVSRVRCALSPKHSFPSTSRAFYEKRASAPHIWNVPVANRSISPTILEEKTEELSIKTIPESESGLTSLVKTMSDLYARRRSSLSTMPNAEVVTMLMNHLTDDDKVETITIRRENKPLGLAIIGGSDTFIPDVIVHDIYPNGAIARDGRIKIGDKLLLVNDVSVANKTNDEVEVMLMMSCPTVTIKFRHADAPIPDQDLYEVIMTVDLMKKPFKGLGISIMGREGALGVYICDILKGGPAEIDGRLQPGDQILEINYEDTRNMSQEDAAVKLRRMMGMIVFKIGRIQKMKTGYAPSYLTNRDDHGDRRKSHGKRMAGHSPTKPPMAGPSHAR